MGMGVSGVLDSERTSLITPSRGDSSFVFGTLGGRRRMMDPSRARIDSVGVDDEEGVSPASSAAPALVHAEHSSRGTLKYRGGAVAYNGTDIVGLSEHDDSYADDAAPPIFSKYGDFHTIDWQRDLARDRLRHKYILGHKKEFPFGTIYGMWDAGSGWICVLMVGLAAGAVAGIIDIGARWMSDLKDGVCADRFWLDREHCCWSANDSVYKDADCSAWTSWPEMLQYYDKNFFYYTLEVFFYCGWSVLMAALTVTLVKVFAPYACGSGIPEIKCILSGFVIRGYLGKWTFIIKSVGLILASASGLNLGKEGP
uniref:H(+)/Cl(-) exchange transporter 3 n=1 Tax=Ascaris lumbricoides TaxID=6252 RepID=A0A0M3IRB9_ASCLU